MNSADDNTMLQYPKVGDACRNIIKGRTHLWVLCISDVEAVLHKMLLYLEGVINFVVAVPAD